MATGYAPISNYTYDTDLVLQATAVTDSASDNSSVVDLGATADGANEQAANRVTGDVVILVSAIEIDTNDETYTFTLVGSDNSDFSTGDQEDLCSIELGANEVLNGDQDSDTGVYILPFINQRNTRAYRYVRLELTIAGTIATGITWQAFIGKTKNL